MATCSPAIADSARKIETGLLKALSSVSQTRVAELMGVSESTVSRFKEGGIEQAAALIAACGMKVVKNDRVCVDMRRYEAMCTLVQAAMSCEETAQRLIWDDQQ